MKRFTVYFFLLKKNENYICLEPVKIIIIIKKIKVLTKSIVLNTQYTYYWTVLAVQYSTKLIKLWYK